MARLLFLLGLLLVALAAIQPTSSEDIADDSRELEDIEQDLEQQPYDKADDPLTRWYMLKLLALKHASADPASMPEKRRSKAGKKMRHNKCLYWKMHHCMF
ncbi:Hypp5858 [Branchiostoma lanceolatum]|uniref:Hypp5858 protein n=1 Tax=Branchiostoma lanceolatum TaxID=7740 RepID=A0A8J9VGU8_BRALA|nr:Hypp5858 [Branchiostoma lanceolatum]